MPHEVTEFVEFLAPYPEQIRELMLSARLRIHEIVGPAQELVYCGAGAISLGFTYRQINESFLNVLAYADSDFAMMLFPWG